MLAEVRKYKLRVAKRSARMRRLRERRQTQFDGPAGLERISTSMPGDDGSAEFQSAIDVEQPDEAAERQKIAAEEEQKLLRYTRQRGKVCCRPPHPLLAQHDAERRARERWVKLHSGAAEAPSKRRQGSTGWLMQHMNRTVGRNAASAADVEQRVQAETHATHDTAAPKVRPRTLHARAAHHTLPRSRCFYTDVGSDASGDNAMDWGGTTAAAGVEQRCVVVRVVCAWSRSPTRYYCSTRIQDAAHSSA